MIHDVVYDSYYDAFIVVGDFTSINGQTRNNLAFIDANTYALMSQAPILSINGVIRSVEHYSYFYNHPILGATTRSYLYLGGDFTLINGYTRNYLSRFLASHVYSQPPAGGLADYSFNPWDAELPVYSSTARDGIHDFLLTGDTLVATGYFSMFSGGTSYTTTQWKNLLTIDADAVTMTTKPFLENYASNSTESIQGIRKLGPRYFIFGQEGAANDEFIYELTPSGAIVQDLESCGSESIVYDFEPHITDIDTLMFSFEQYAASAAFSSYELDASPIFCPFNPVGNSIIDLSTIGLNNNFLEVYKNYLLITDGSGFYSSKRNGQANVGVSANFQTNANWLSAYPSVNSSPCFKRLDDKLFVSSNNLTNINGSIRNGLAVLCLEPSDAKPFTSFDPTACEGDSSIYTIPQAEFADGYRWTYSGTGALYHTIGATTWSPLSTEILSGTNMNSIEIYFPSGSTGGTLSVEPFSVCNTTTDYQFSQGQSDAISVNPLPTYSMSSNVSLNCYSDTAIVAVNSINPNAQFIWSYNGASDTTDTIIITVNDPVLVDSIYYIMEITDLITGCFQVDSTFFTLDLTADQMDASLTFTNPSEWTCLTDSMTLNSNQTGYLVTWAEQASPGTFYSDPYTIYTAPSGNFNIHGTQLSNGCSTQAAYAGITVNTESADPILVGHPNFIIDLVDDSLSCTNPSITLQCDVSPAYSGIATAQWSVNGTDILNLTTADSLGLDASNLKYYTIVTTHNTSQCVDSTQIIVRFDFDQPTYSVHGDETINCSQTEVLLDHILSGTVLEGWLDPSGQQTFSDSLLATTTGEYYYQVQSDNGCVSIDTVQVTQSLDLLLDMPTDTLICPYQVVIIAPSIIGNTETPSFVWSTGSTTPSESAAGGIDSELSVIVSTPSGCTGYDTTTISITAPVDATITPIVGCTDGNLEVTSISGGAGNYQYALDGSTWQPSTNFGGLAFGDYTISVLDDLGCVYDFDQSLDGTASSIEMQFAASTYNQEGDTIVLVNITDFTGLDSISWILPTIADVSFENDSIVILSIATGGWYDVDLIGYLGSSCEYTYTTSVYFGDHSPVFDSAYTSNGIQSFVISPNPTNGSFNVALEFGTAQNYSILVTNSLGQPIVGMSVNNVGTVVNHSFQFPIGTPAGSYRIHVIADYDAQQKMIILN